MRWRSTVPPDAGPPSPSASGGASLPALAQHAAGDPGPQQIPDMTPEDPDRVRRAARALAVVAGLDSVAVESVTLAATELATNLLRYAHNGVMYVALIEREPASEQRWGVHLESRDDGPGIADVALALRDGYSTSG